MNNFEGRVKNLSSSQRGLLAKQIGAKGRVKMDSVRSLVAYLTSDKVFETKVLQEALRSRLPEYMIPSKFVLLDKFPRLPNGKIDSKSLSVPIEKENRLVESVNTISKTETEKQLIEIWEKVLDFAPIRVDDNFFEIGGDSILSIQIVAKARKLGIVLAPNQLFEHQTVSELARFAKTETEDIDEETSVGDVQLLPIQYWFFEEHKNAPHHWNQALTFKPPESFDFEILRKSVGQLASHHNALRLSFVKEGEEWTSAISDREYSDSCHLTDLTDVSSDEIEKVIELRSAEWQASLNLSNSALFQAIFFDCGEKSKNRLLFIAHHLIVDSVSWGILIEDLETIYRQLENDETVSLSSKTKSYKKWGEHLIELAKTDELSSELEFWESQIVGVDSVPTDFERELPYFVESVRIVESIVDKNTTDNLLLRSNKAYGTNTDEILITALMRALEKWKGIKNVCLGLEKHGRETGKSTLDLSNTVGWFTTYFPVRFEIQNSEDLKMSIVSTKETLRQIPNKGLGYGVLRYLRGENQLSQQPAVIFNYLGKQESLRSEVLGKGNWTRNAAHSPKAERYNLFGINAFIEDGELHTVFDFSDEIYKTETIESLMWLFEKELRRIIEHCGNQESAEYTPSDFAEADLNQDDLDNLISRID